MGKWEFSNVRKVSTPLLYNLTCQVRWKDSAKMPSGWLIISWEKYSSEYYEVKISVISQKVVEKGIRGLQNCLSRERVYIEILKNTPAKHFPQEDWEIGHFTKPLECAREKDSIIMEKFTDLPILTKIGGRRCWWRTWRLDSKGNKEFW